MTRGAETFMGAKSQALAPGALGEAVAELLRRRHPYHTMNLVAADLNCSLKTAENYLNGHLSGPGLVRLLNVYGASFGVDAVLLAAETTLTAIIQEKARHAEQEERRWAEIRRFTETQADILARSEARSAQPESLVGRSAEPAG